MSSPMIKHLSYLNSSDVYDQRMNRVRMIWDRVHQEGKGGLALSEAKLEEFEIEPVCSCTITATFTSATRLI